MFDVAESYQEQQAVQSPVPQAYSFAIVGEVHSDGLSLLWPGAERPSQKHYKCNTTCQFEAGQKVYVIKNSGSYVVLCPIGNPSSTQAAP